MDISVEETEEFLNNSDESDETMQLTPAEVIELMEEAWVNEKFAPELLPHKSEIVDCLLGQITYMEANLRNLDSNDFKKSVHQLEVDRLRFLVSSYLRTRLEKIETFISSVIKQEEQRSERGEEPYLTEQEMKFAKDYSYDLERYFSNVYQFYPGLPTEDWCNQAVVPNLHSFVFLKSKKEVEGVIIDDGNEGDTDLVDLTQGSQMIISYNSVANLVKRGDVHLI